MVLRQKTVILSLDTKFSVVSSLLIYYALALFSVLFLLNYMPFVGLQGLQSIAGTLLPFEISLILLASLNDVKKQAF